MFEQLKNRIKEIRKNNFKKKYKIDYNIPTYIILNDPKIMLKAVKIDPQYLNNAREGALTDEVIDKALEKGYMFDSFASSYLMSNPKIMLKAVEQDPQYLNYAEEGALTDEVIDKAFANDYKFDARSTSSVKNNPRIMLKAVEQDPQYLNYAEEGALTDEVIDKAFANDYKFDARSTSSVKNNPRIMLKAVEQDPQYLNYAKEGALTDEAIDKAFEKGYKFDNYFASSYLMSNPKIMLKAVEQDPQNLNYAREGTLTDEVIDKALEKGYMFDISFASSYLMSNPKIVLKAVEQNPQNLNYAREGTLTDEVIDKAFEKGYKFDENASWNIINSPQVILKAVEQDSQNLNYAEEGALTDEVIDKAFEKGYKFDGNASWNIKNSPQAILKAVEQNPQNLNYAREGTLTDEVIDKAFEKGYKFDENASWNIINSPRIMLKAVEQDEKNIYYCGDIVFENENFINGLKKNPLFKYIEYFDSSLLRSIYFKNFDENNRLITNLIMILGENNISNFFAFVGSTNDFEIYFDEKLDFEKLKEIYDKTKNNKKYESVVKYAHGFDYLTKCAKYILKFPKDITSESEENIIEKIISKEIDNFDLNNEINNILNSDKNINEKLCNFLFGVSCDNAKDIIYQFGSIESIKRLRNKYYTLKEKNEEYEEMYQMCSKMLVNLNFIEELLFVENRNINDFKKFIEKNKGALRDLRFICRNYRTMMADIFTKDSNLMLTQMDKLPKGSKVTKNPYYDLIDLSESQYSLYIHVGDINSIGENHHRGINHLCISAASDINVKTYLVGGMIIGFSKIPNGAFIGSSNINLGSNGSIQGYNSDALHFYQNGLRETTLLLRDGHSETDVWREELVPSCIVLPNRDTPTEEEIEFRKEIMEKFDLEYLPFVKIQQLGTRCNVKPENITIKDTYPDPQVKVKEEKTIEDELEDLNETEENVPYRIFKEDTYNIGGTHDIYTAKMKYNDEGIEKVGRFYIKPNQNMNGTSDKSDFRYPIAQATADIEKLVGIKPLPIIKTKINGLDAIATLAVEGSIDFSNTQTMLEQGVGTLNIDELKFFLREFVADHLLYNYDTKGDNFLKSADGQLYGIDKGQAFSRNLENFSTNFQVGNICHNDKNPIYGSIMAAISDGRIVDLNGQNLNIEQISNELKEVLNICENINNIPDEIYLKIFESYLNTRNRENAKSIEEKILLLKNNLADDFKKFFGDYLVKEEEHSYER